MTQPNALFLADILEDGGKPADIAEKAANELRRLHAIVAAREDDIETHSAAVYEATRLLAQAREQRDALLEALKKIAADHEYFSGDTLSYARAAIKAAEKNT